MSRTVFSQPDLLCTTSNPRTDRPILFVCKVNKPIVGHITHMWSVKYISVIYEDLYIQVPDQSCPNLLHSTGGINCKKIQTFNSATAPPKCTELFCARSIPYLSILELLRARNKAHLTMEGTKCFVHDFFFKLIQQATPLEVYLIKKWDKRNLIFSVTDFWMKILDRRKGGGGRCEPIFIQFFYTIFFIQLDITHWFKSSAFSSPELKA